MRTSIGDAVKKLSLVILLQISFTGDIYAEKHTAEFRTAIDWINQSKQVLDNYYRVYANSALVDEVSESLIANEVTENFAVRQGTSLLQSIRSEFDNVKEAHAKLLPPPELSDNSMRRFIEIHVELLRTLQRDVERAIDVSQEILLAAIEGDVHASDRLAQRQLDQFIAMLHNENRMISLASANIKQSHPQNKLQESVMASNSAMISIMQYLKTSQQGDLEFGRHFAHARNMLNEAELHLRSGNKLAKKMKNDFRIQASDSMEEKRTKKILIEMLDTYPESIDNEKKIIDIVYILMDSIELSVENMDSSFVDNLEMHGTILEFERLVDERLRLDRERTALATAF